MEACGLRLHPSRDSELLSRAPNSVRRLDRPPAVQAQAPGADKQEKVGPGEMLVAAQQMEGARPQAKCTARPPGEEGSGDRGHAQTPEPGPLGHLPRSWRVPCPLLTRSVRAVHTEQDLLTLECSRRTTCWPWTRTARSSSSTQSRSPRC